MHNVEQNFRKYRKKITEKIDIICEKAYNSLIRLMKGAVSEMLKKFCVENFRGFPDKITFDLGTPCNYSFRPNVVQNGCISKGIIYGINGSGKSNLGIAIFDIITHLTDNQKLPQGADLYLNLNGRKLFAEFEYEFVFDGHEVIYKYQKAATNLLFLESLSIDNKEVIYYDFRSQEGFTRLAGTETLNASITNTNPISRVKYVNSNSILEDNVENQIFKKFIRFVEHMLLFYSLDSKGYEGFMSGGENIDEGIIKSGKIRDFEQFLRMNGIEYNLVVVEKNGKQSISCKFGQRYADFFNVASTGTRSLALFYYWYIKMNEASFVYIDEFDAFYHFELAENVEKCLREINGVQIFSTTHNTDLMSNDLLRPDCYFILRDNKIKALPQLTEKELRQAHNLQKMYKAGAFHG